MKEKVNKIFWTNATFQINLSRTTYQEITDLKSGDQGINLKTMKLPVGPAQPVYLLSFSVSAEVSLNCISRIHCCRTLQGQRKHGGWS